MFTPIFFIAAAFIAGEAQKDSHWWDAKVEASIARSPDRKKVWEDALETTKQEQRAGIAYLVTFLPLRDLEKLDPDSLVKNVDLANQARAEVPWGKGLPEEIFLDAVLPHVSITEPREPMRAEFHGRYLPLVKDCKTPGEAARKINENLFKDYKVVYNTKRLRTDQSSRESIAQGMATCSGLSIMLIEACRSVGIPARFAGIHSWPGRGGNHTWVEIWDQGDWHYVGAAEPDPKGLDHAWFGGEASKAIKEKRLNAIFAATYRTTGEFFPLAWNPSAKVPGENVTDRYQKPNVATSNRPRLMVEVRENGERVVAEVVALDRKSGETRLSGESLGPQIDVNRHLSVEATAGESFIVAAPCAKARDVRLGDRSRRYRRSARSRSSSFERRCATNSPNCSGIASARTLPNATWRASSYRKSPSTKRCAGSRGRLTKSRRYMKSFAKNGRPRPSRPRTARVRTFGGMSARSRKTAGRLVIAMHGGGNARRSQRSAVAAACSTHIITIMPKLADMFISRCARRTILGTGFTMMRSVRWSSV